MNHTPNYALTQWSRTDRVLMEDFNADNAAIDAALGSLAQTAAAHTEALSKLSNCRVYLTSYTGNGIYELDHSPRVELPAVPDVLIVVGNESLMFQLPKEDSRAIILRIRGSGFFGIKWEDSVAILQQYSTNESQYMNSSNVKYHVFALYQPE